MPSWLLSELNNMLSCVTKVEVAVPQSDCPTEGHLVGRPFKKQDKSHQCGGRPGVSKDVRKLDSETVHSVRVMAEHSWLRWKCCLGVGRQETF